MAQVEKLELEHSFQGDVINQAAGRAPVNPKALDQALIKTADNINLLNENLQLIQRDDGAIRDGVVGLEQIKTEVINVLQGFNLRGSFLESQYYDTNDCVDWNGSKWVCKTPHNSTDVFIESNWLRFGYIGSEDASYSAYLAQQSANKADLAQKSTANNADTVANLVSSARAASNSAASNAQVASSSAANSLESMQLASSAKERAEAAAMALEEFGNSAVYVPEKKGGAGVIGGTARVGVDGVPFFIEDENHKYIGFTAIEHGATAHDLRVRYEHRFSSVGTLLATPDESLAPYMLNIGGSVAQGYAELKIVAPLYFSAKCNGDITAISPLWQDSVSFDAANSNPASGYIVFKTPTKPLSANQPIVTSRGDAAWASTGKAWAAYSAPTAIKIGAFSDVISCVRVRYVNSEFVITGNDVTGFSAAMSGGLITITHTASKNGFAARVTQPVNSNNSYVINNYGKSTTTFAVYASNGTAISVPDTSIDFIFSYDAATVKRALEPLSATDEFTVFAGYYYVPIVALGKVPSGNLWIFGAMNK